MWRRGWCRNPRLYSPQESHLVDQDSLDCSRGLGSLWEPADGDADQPRTAARSERRPLVLFGPTAQLAPAGAGIVASSGFGTGGSGSAGNGGGQHAGPPRPDRPGSPTGQERSVSFQPEERYWTDYLRIALPVAGLLVLLGLLWYWAGSFIGGGSDSPIPTPTQVLGQVTPINAPTATLAASPTAPAVAAATGPPPTPTVINPTVAPPTPVPTSQPGAANTNPACVNLPTYEQGETVVTKEDVNLRQDATTESASLGVLAAGTELQITGRFIDLADCDWWPVTDPATGQSGHVREDFLQRPPTQ
jgi:hypothetical protein